MKKRPAYWQSLPNILRPLLRDISVVKKPFTPCRKRGIFVQYLMVIFVSMNMLLIFTTLCLSSPKHQLHQEVPNVDHQWTKCSCIWVFKVGSLQRFNFMAYLTAHPSAATWLITLTRKHDHIKSILFSLYQLSVNHCIILKFYSWPTRHSTTWHHCTFEICLHPTIHWVNYVNHLKFSYLDFTCFHFHL